MDGWWRVLTKRGPLEKGMANDFSILAFRTPWTVWKCDGQGSLACYSPWGHKESDTTEQLNWTEFALIHGPNILDSYAILLFTESDFASITSHIHNWVLFSLWLCHFILSGIIFHWSPVAYWAPIVLDSSIFSVLPFCFFILFMGFSWQEYWSGLPFPSPLDHSLLELSTMTHTSSEALYHMQLGKAVVHVISLISFSMSVVFILSAFWWIRIRG